MEFRHLEAFVAVAEELHFSRAATRLRVTQPHLSKLVRALEEELKVALLLRRPRNNELTAAGRSLLQDARVILQQAQEAARRASAAGLRQRATFRIGTKSNAASSGISDALVHVAPLFPTVQFRFEEGCTEALLQQLVQKRLDMVFAIGRVEHPALSVQVLSNERVQVLLSAGHEGALSRSLDIATLQDRPWLLCARPMNRHVHDVLKGFLLSKGVEPDLIVELQSPEAMHAEVAANLAYAFVPQSWARYLRPNVVAIPVRGRAPLLTSFLAWRKSDKRECVHALVRATLDGLPKAALHPRRHRADAPR